MSSWEDEEARRRGFFRMVNEQIAELREGFDLDGRVPFVCECGNRECTKTIVLTRGEYESVRDHARCFLIALDHENPALEVVVSENGCFAVTETLVGEASRIAEETDLRRRPAIAVEEYERSA